MDVEVVIVGAGVAGLTCAATLAAHGVHVVVVDKGRGVGGRCATRRVEGQPVDHGPAFFHGSDVSFLSALRDASPDRLDGWPVRVTGDGTPCDPGALRTDGFRLAFAEGASAFPKSLATGLDVRLRTRVVSLERGGGAIRAVCDDGSRFRAADVVLALPAGQAHELAQPLLGRGDHDLDAAGWLIEGLGSERCLTTIALYDRPGGPPWDMCYPTDTASLQVVSHDSRKRRDPARTALVLQAGHAWSLAHWDEPPERVSAAMLADAGRVVGDWAASPQVVDTMRWRHARRGGADALTRPIVCGAPGRGRIGFAGECFAPGAGVEAAWRSGRELANRLVSERTVS